MNTVYEMCSWNDEVRPCIGDLVKQGLVSKRVVRGSEGDIEDIIWFNKSEQTFTMLSGKEQVQFKPNTSI